MLSLDGHRISHACKEFTDAQRFTESLQASASPPGKACVSSLFTSPSCDQPRSTLRPVLERPLRRLYWSKLRFENISDFLLTDHSTTGGAGCVWAVKTLASCLDVKSSPRHID